MNPFRTLVAKFKNIGERKKFRKKVTTVSFPIITSGKEEVIHTKELVLGNGQKFIQKTYIRASEKHPKQGAEFVLYAPAKGTMDERHPKPIGHLLLRRVSEFIPELKDQNSMYISSTQIVDTKNQQRGLFNQMETEAEHLARTTFGAKKVYLITWDKKTQRIFEKVGFRVVKIEGVKQTAMVKDLI